MQRPPASLEYTPKRRLWFRSLCLGRMYVEHWKSAGRCLPSPTTPPRGFLVKVAPSKKCALSHCPFCSSHSLTASRRMTSSTTTTPRTLDVPLLVRHMPCARLWVCGGACHMPHTKVTGAGVVQPSRWRSSPGPRWPAGCHQNTVSPIGHPTLEPTRPRVISESRPGRFSSRTHANALLQYTWQTDTCPPHVCHIS